MSDREVRGGSNDEDLSLPRATVAKMIQGTGSSSSDLSLLLLFPRLLNRSYPSAADGVLPQDRPQLTFLSSFSLEPRRDRPELLPDDVTCAKDTRDLVIECCVGKTKVLAIAVASVLTPLRM
jgi:hypothetical protein